MLRSIVEGAVATQPDLRLADDGEAGSLEEAVRRTEADVLIAADDRPEATFRALIAARPSLKVFVLTHDGRNATVLEFTRARLSDASPTTLIEAIRMVLRRAATQDDL
jgi:DNA-binding NarL/FixJ family response regulator